MGWSAKPRGGYDINSVQATGNMIEFYEIAKNSYTLESICGILGNMYAESGLNPWRWQNDTVSLTSSSKGYGLPQFTPAYGYINNYGTSVSGFAPNLSTSTQTSGANVSDGRAQTIVIINDLAHKYIDRSSYCDYLDITSAYPLLGGYSVLTNLWLATVAWLFDYEFPQASSRTQEKALQRYEYAQYAFNYLTEYIDEGEHPYNPPVPPDPPFPPAPKSKNMTLYMMLRNPNRY